jgi:hypothetical protein
MEERAKMSPTRVRRKNRRATTASVARKTRIRVARREGSNGVVMQRDLWCLIHSDKMRVGVGVPRAVEASVLLSLGGYGRRSRSFFLQNWLVQGTFLGSDESTDLYIGYYGSIMHEHMSTVLFSVASRDSGELLKQVPI